MQRRSAASTARKQRCAAAPMTRKQRTVGVPKGPKKARSSGIPCASAGTGAKPACSSAQTLTHLMKTPDRVITSHPRRRLERATTAASVAVGEVRVITLLVALANAVATHCRRTEQRVLHIRRAAQTVAAPADGCQQRLGISQVE